VLDLSELDVLMMTSFSQVDVSNLTCPWYVNLWHDMLAWA
jgi:hypothetical protein